MRNRLEEERAALRRHAQHPAHGRDPLGNVIELLEHAPGDPSVLRFED